MDKYVEIALNCNIAYSVQVWQFVQNAILLIMLIMVNVRPVNQDAILVIIQLLAKVV